MSVSDDRDIPFYWGMTRKYIICFSSILANLKVLKYNDVGDVVKTVNVPYSYTTKDKRHYKEQRVDSIVNQTYPRIGYRFTTIVKDSTREGAKMVTIPVLVDEVNEEFVYGGKPYNYNVDVHIVSKTQNDMFQIVENLVSRFDSDYLLSITDIPKTTIKSEIQVVLNSIDLPDDYDLDNSSDRELEGTMNFTLKGFIYPAVDNDYIIKQIQLQYASEIDGPIIDTTIIEDLSEA